MMKEMPPILLAQKILFGEASRRFRLKQVGKRDGRTS